MSDFEERESLVFTNEGQKIFSILHLPKKITSKIPCVIVCHGLGGHKTGRYRAYVDLAEMLVKKNIAALRFDFRGSGDSEGLFSEMTLKGELSDAILMINYIKTHPLIDPSRIGIFGRSFGGAIAILTAIHTNAISSIVLWAPLFNGEQWREQWDKIGSVSKEESEAWRMINGQVASLSFYAELFDMQIKDKLDGLRDVPLLLIHGLKDEVISDSHSEMYYQARQSAPAATEFLKLPTADHDFSNSQDRGFALEKTVEWFQKTL